MFASLLNSSEKVEVHLELPLFQMAVSNGMENQ
jgi:hypothetical protein